MEQAIIIKWYATTAVKLYINGEAMIFRQLFDRNSCTYTYLLASRRGGEALLIDPVLEQVDRYLQLLAELELRLVKALDTHLHADHVTGLGALRDRTRCVTVMSENSQVDVVSMRVADGDRLHIEGLELTVLQTPGHTDDSCCFLFDDRIFSGDTLLIRGTGRTDFQNGDAVAQYHSIFDRLLRLPDETLVYPGHDYKGDTVSTIAEERRYNPRLQVSGLDEYVNLMNNLNLPNPKFMDVAVPANMKIGLSQEQTAARGWSLDAAHLVEHLQDNRILLVDLRDDEERAQHGVLPGCLHVPYAQVEASVREGGILHGLCESAPRQVIFYCAYGERSAMAVQMAQEAGFDNARHLDGGLSAWKASGYGMVRPGDEDPPQG